MLESKRRGIIFLGLSFFLALLAGFFFLQKVSALNADLGGMTEVYVADTDITSRAIIQPEQVTTIEVPNRFVTDSHITSFSDLENKVSVVPLKEGDIFTRNMLKQVSAVASEGNRLVALIFSDRVSHDQDLEALDRVDIIVSHSFQDEPKTETFMKDVLVAMVANEGILLEVSADEAPELIHMQNYADSVRVLKANVEKNASQPQTEPSQEQQSPDEPSNGSQQNPDATDDAEQATNEEVADESQEESEPQDETGDGEDEDEDEANEKND